MSSRPQTRTPSLTTSESESSFSDPASDPPSPTHLAPLSIQSKPSSINAGIPLALRPGRPRHLSLTSVIKQSKVLACTLHFLSVDDFFSLTSTCRDLRQIFRHVDLKDAVLSRFVPGYRACLLSKDLQTFVDVQVSIHDLRLFLISEKIGLHVYPLRTLSLMSPRAPPSPDLNDLFIKLRDLAQAHSRFVLLVQSLAHSSSSPLAEIDNLGFTPSFPSGIKELQFPAPLSYHEFGLKDSSVISTRDIPSSNRRTTKSNPALGPARLRKGTSIFGRPKLHPPPPSSDPALRMYSESWRRSLRQSSWAVDELGSLRSPRRRFTSDDFSSDLSSFSPSRFASERDESPSRLRSTSPHDFGFASSRAHAPILRVFVPCTKLDDPSIAACENQLIDADLWTHLSEGDIVCNLGYVPPTDVQPPMNGDSSSTTTALWLFFDGSNLVPYSPLDPPPIRDVLALPSPFYYSHILPPLSNPTFILDLPSHLSLPNQARPQFSLSSVMTKVKSPRSAGGFVVIKQYKWLAILGEPKAGVGSVWQTEWIFEGEGTAEGKRILNDLITGRERYDLWTWEIDREKCSQTRIWFRLSRRLVEDVNTMVDPASVLRTALYSS